MMCRPKVFMCRKRDNQLNQKCHCAVSQKDEMEQGRIRIVHVKEDVLKGSGASRLTVEQSSPEQRPSWTPDSTQVRKLGSQPSGFMLVAFFVTFCSGKVLYNNITYLLLNTERNN